MQSRREAPGDTIHFAIGAAGAHTITLASNLPTITGERHDRRDDPDGLLGRAGVIDGSGAGAATTASMFGGPEV